MWWPDVAHAALADDLLHAVRAQDFGATADSKNGGAAVAHFPSIDLAVVRFAPGAAPRWANVLFSREFVPGVVADIDAAAGAVSNIRFDADQHGANGESIAWRTDADWSRLSWLPLVGSGALRFVAPYPASLLKLMVAVGVGLAVDRGLCGWPAALEPMIVTSDNDATTECVALLHRLGLMDTLNRRFQELGLRTLQINGTRPDGGWRNGDGSGVGQIHMTAWDTVRLLWLLDAAAPPTPWLRAGTTLLQDRTREHLHGVLQRQQLNEILSSGSLRDMSECVPECVPGWVPGLPDSPQFAHKTGNTENYASDAGIVRTASAHYLVAVLTSLGQRYAPHERCATTWRLPALGAALHQLMETPAS